MKFHKEGWPSLMIVLAFSIGLISLVKWLTPDVIVLHWLAYLISGFLTLVIVQFFRHPKRKLTEGEDLIVAPADGKVVVIEETIENEHFKDKRIQVSIFMSPINVHVNRFPIGGMVTYFKYHPGKFMAAWEPKSSTDNERTTVVVKHKKGTEVLFRQVAGALARRLVWYCEAGDHAKQSQEMGFIKFGSRVDLYFPLGTELNVKIGDTVKGGVSVIGKI